MHSAGFRKLPREGIVRVYTREGTGQVDERGVQRTSTQVDLICSRSSSKQLIALYNDIQKAAYEDHNPAIDNSPWSQQTRPFMLGNRLLSG